MSWDRAETRFCEVWMAWARATRRASHSDQPSRTSMQSTTRPMPAMSVLDCRLPDLGGIRTAGGSLVSGAGKFAPLPLIRERFRPKPLIYPSDFIDLDRLTSDCKAVEAACRDGAG